MHVDREEASEKGGRAAALVLALVIAIALILRVAWVDFGLPSMWHPDEVQASVHVSRWCRGDFAPVTGMYRHPLLLRNAAFAGISAARLIAPSQVGEPVRPEAITLALRLVSVVFGTLSVPALYLLARALTGRAPALAAAAIFAILPINVISAKYGVPDTLLSFWVISTLWIALRIARGASPPWYFAGGLSAALAFGSKYNAVFLAVPLVIAHARAAKQVGAQLGARAWLAPRPLGALAAGAAIGLAASFPLLFRDAGALVNDLRYEREHLFVAGHGGHRLGAGDGDYVFHFVNSVPATTGPLLLVFIIAGLVFLLARMRPDDLLLSSFVVPYYLAMEHVYKIPPNFERYVLPLIGPYVIAAVLLAEALAPWAARRAGRLAPRPAIAAALLAIVLGAHPAIRAVQVTLGMRPGADTRVVMQRWMEDHLPPRTRAIAPLASSYYPDGVQLLSMSLPELPRRVAALRAPSPSDVEGRIVHVLASSLVYDRALRFPEAQPELARFYARVFAEGELLATFESPSGRYLYQNPTLRLYRMVQAAPAP